MKKKNLLFMSIMSLALCFLVACGNDEKDEASAETSGSAEGKSGIVLDISYTTGPESANAKGINKFIEELERLTDGEVSGAGHPNNQFGGEREVVEMLGIDALEMGLTSAGPMGTFVEEFYALDLPFLFENEEHAYAVLDGDIGERFSKSLEETANVVVLGYMENGYREPTNSVRAFNSVDDVDGIKMRTQESELQIDTWKAYGANPTPVAWPETFTGLQQKVIDGQANPIDVIYDMNFQEVQDHMAIIKDVYSPMLLMISKPKFETLDPKHQEALREAGKIAVAYQREQSQLDKEKFISELEEQGVAVTYPDRAEFEAKLDGVYEKWSAKLGAELIDDIRNYEY